MNIDLETSPYFGPASDAGTTELQTMAAFELPPPNFGAPEQSQMEHALDTKALLRRFKILQRRQVAEAEHYLEELLDAARPEKSSCEIFSDDSHRVRDRQQDSPRTLASGMREPPKRMFHSAVVGLRTQMAVGGKTLFSNIAGTTGLWKILAKKFLPECIRKFAGRTVESHVFSLASSLIVIANAILVTYYLDRDVRYSTSGATGDPPWAQEEYALDLIFAVLFTVELLFRFMKDELRLFMTTHKDFMWNLLDLLIVSCEWFERSLTASAEAGSDIDVSLLRIFRIFRIVRFVRFIRLLRIVSEVRLITICLLKSVMPLIWSLVCMSIILFVFANAFVIGVATASKKLQHRLDLIYFCDFPTTMLTLLAVITQGVDWLSPYEEIAEIDPWYGAGFLIFVALMVIGVLNVISSIFIQIAMSKAQSDRALLQANEKERQAELMRSLGELFRQLHATGAQTITFEEWQRKVAQLDIQASLMRLGLDPARCLELFDLIDVDGNREIDLEEFVAGCLQLMGQAKALDMETFVRSMKIQMVNANKNMAKMLHDISEELGSYRATVDLRHCFELSSILKAIDEKHHPPAPAQSAPAQPISL